MPHTRPMCDYYNFSRQHGSGYTQPKLAAEDTLSSCYILSAKCDLVAHRDVFYFLASARAFASTASLLFALTPIFFVPSMLYDEEEASLVLGGRLPRLAWPPVDSWLGMVTASALGAARAASPAHNAADDAAIKVCAQKKNRLNRA